MLQECEYLDEEMFRKFIRMECVTIRLRNLDTQLGKTSNQRKHIQ